MPTQNFCQLSYYYVRHWPELRKRIKNFCPFRPKLNFRRQLERMCLLRGCSRVPPADAVGPEPRGLPRGARAGRLGVLVRQRGHRAPPRGRLQGTKEEEVLVFSVLWTVLISLCVLPPCQRYGRRKRNKNGYIVAAFLLPYFAKPSIILFSP